jgi:hypothetical protein
VRAVNEENIPPSTIESNMDIRPPEAKELRSVCLKSGKSIPHRMHLKVEASCVPHHVRTYVKLPDQTEYEDLGDLCIVKGTVYLPTPYVFLSYAREDADVVSKINSNLRKAGILTWLDKHDIYPGDDWERKIEEGIESSDYFLVFLSPKSINKTGVFQKEIKYALDQMLMRPSGQSFIIPVLLENCQPPREFRGINWCCAWENNWFELLLKSLRR